MGACLVWALFQLWAASPIPFALGWGVFNDTEVRFLHLTLGVFIGYLSYPALKRSSRTSVPVSDWLLALVASASIAYLFFWYSEIAARPSSPVTSDLIASAIGIVLLLEVTRRCLGLPMVILAVVFLLYVFFGPYMPGLLAHKGASIARVASHFWLTTEGVFGVALGVSASFIFMFVLFGALLERAGAGNYFIMSAMSLLGHLRGGPAKASVVASASTGMISGSSIANVVTTGTFTIPLMKRVGYPAHKAAAVEVAASVDGQIMPPVMGAAAFLMVEYVGIPYTQVLKHALLPAVISYIALFYIVHIEAMKAGIQGLPRGHVDPIKQRTIRWGLTISGLIIFSALCYWVLMLVKSALGAYATPVVIALLIAVYLLALRHSAKQDKTGVVEADQLVETPPVASTIQSGLHFLLPVVVLIWNLMVEHLSPGLSAFYATVFLILIVVTQKPLTRLFSKEDDVKRAALEGLIDLREGLVSGSRNMVGIAIATATAGIIVGTVTLTGIGLVMIELVEILSGGNLLLMLALVAVICLVLGLGLPTTANYIVVSTLMAPVVVEVGAQNGLLVPLIAVHLFVFYFGLMADVTPPVGLATYAAAGIAKVDALKTGVTAFFYSIRTAILPFMFIFNTQLLLIDIPGPVQLVLVVLSATLASMMFAAATQGFFLRKNRVWETIALLIVMFALFRPGFFLDLYAPPYEQVPASEFKAKVAAAPDNAQLRIFISGVNLEGNDISKGVLLPLGPQRESPDERLHSVGVSVVGFGDSLQISQVRFGSVAEKLGMAQGFEITAIEQPVSRPAKEWVFIPALLLLALVAWAQRRRPAPV
jgi:TRAP transporter 4TM/12TM fusion protein